MIVERIKDQLNRTTRTSKPSAFRASEVGFLCARYQYHAQKDWQLQPPPSETLASIFALGEELEGYVKRKLEEVGIPVKYSQSPFFEKRMNVIGHVDGVVELDGENVALEIKSVNSFTWAKLERWADMCDSKSPIVRRWAFQLPIYMWMGGFQRGLYLLLNKETGELKEVPVTLEEAWPALCELEAFLKQVSEALQVGKPPEPAPASPEFCRYCWAKKVGLCEGVRANLPGTVDVAAVEEAAQIMEATKEAHDAYEKAKEKLVAALAGLEVAPGAKLETLVGTVPVRISCYEQTRYDVPKEVKEQYARKTLARRVEILGL
jgi:CRISPR/Cas system-associated exonuclease Cas4 (RecB family)